MEGVFSEGVGDVSQVEVIPVVEVRLEDGVEEEGGYQQESVCCHRLTEHVLLLGVAIVQSNPAPYKSKSGLN